VKLGCSVEGSIAEFSILCLKQNALMLNYLKPSFMSRYAMYSTVNIIFVNFDNHSFEIGLAISSHLFGPR